MARRRYRDFENEEIVKIGAKYHLLHHFGNYMSEANALRGIKRWKATKSFFPAVVIEHPLRLKKKFMIYGGIGIGKPMTKKGYEKVLKTPPNNLSHLIKEGNLIFAKTKKEHADIYGIDSDNPLFIQHLCIDTKDRQKGFGSKVLEYIENYAKENNHDLIFGHIPSKANFTKDKRANYFCDVDLIKYWLKDNGYAINQDNNDFHKVISGSTYADGGETSKLLASHIWFVSHPSYIKHIVKK